MQSRPTRQGCPRAFRQRSRQPSLPHENKTYRGNLFCKRLRTRPNPPSACPKQSRQPILPHRHQNLQTLIASRSFAQSVPAVLSCAWRTSAKEVPAALSYAWELVLQTNAKQVKTTQRWPKTKNNNASPSQQGPEPTFSDCFEPIVPMFGNNL